MPTMGSRYIIALALLAAPIGITALAQLPSGAESAADLGQPAPDRVTPPSAPKDLGSLERCGCKLTSATSLREPEACRLKERPSLIGLEGYLKTGDREVDKKAPPWRISELKQTGPEKWDGFLGQRTAKTRVRVEAQVDDSSPSKVRLKVTDTANKGTPAFWIKLQDFDPVPWWQCPADKAVQHSAILVRPKPAARPVTIEGRWINKTLPKRLWCWTWVSKVGVYCDPAPSKNTSMSETWIFQPDEVQIEY